MQPTPPLPPWIQPGPPGQPRPSGRCFAIGLATIGLGLYVWTYRVHKEMKAHSGQGVGGGIAVVIMLAASLVMPFLTSAEVGGLYKRRGLPEPVRALTGLWVLVPALAGYLLAVAGALAVALLVPEAGSGPVIVGALVAYLALLLPCTWVWFWRTNEALNRYWQQLA